MPSPLPSVRATIRQSSSSKCTDDVGFAVAVAVLVHELLEHFGCNTRDLLDAFGCALGPFGDVRVPFGPALDAVNREIAGEPMPNM